MLARDGSVLVDAPGGAPHHRLEILAEVGRFEVGIQIAGEMVAQVLGVLRVVVAADAPRVLVFGKISGNELDRVEGIGFTGLSGGQHSAVDRFLGNL